MISFPNLADNISDMEKEQIVLLTCATIGVLSFGAFIFWGPTPHKRRGAVIGLQNLGLTCFLNTLLQALASCIYFIDWLEIYKDQGPIANSLYFVINVLSKDRSRLVDIEEPLAPTCVIEALKKHGWTLGHGEQDAHELFHLIIVSLEEEAHKALAFGVGLTEVLDTKRQPDMCDQIETINKDQEECESRVNCQLYTNDTMGDSAKPPVSPPLVVNKRGEPIRHRMVPKYDTNRNYQPSPFCGLLTSQLQCAKCNFKSVLRYDKFDSLSLHLPNKPHVRHTLYQLLRNYTEPEEVADVECEGCNKELAPGQPRISATSIKTLTIGKLPRCLCIHIHRLSLEPNGSPYKRSDFVDFPEFLNMSPFTHNSIAKIQKIKENGEGKNETVATTNDMSIENRTCNHMYRLKAVIVHSGTAESGHFVTYRRGPLDSNIRHRSERWYFTSDDTVRDATLAEAMQALAYMLFYEKCFSPPT